MKSPARKGGQRTGKRGQENEQVHREGGARGGGNPEFAPDSKLISGLEADGFVIMLMKGDRPSATVIHGVTTMDLARLIASDESEAGSVIAQAIAIAEGLNKAAEIEKSRQKMNMARGLAEILRGK